MNSEVAVVESAPPSKPQSGSRSLPVVRTLLHMAGIIGSVVLLSSNCWWLLQQPRVGVADNGDFWRVARPAGISPVEPHRPDGRYVDPWYEVGSSVLFPKGVSAPALLAWAAAHFHDENQQLDIRAIGTLYLLVSGVMVLVALIFRVNAWFVLAVLYVLSDSGYLLFFNSFYADGALIVALVGLVLWFEWFRGRTFSEKARGAGVAAAVVPLLLVLGGGWSKAQYSTLPAAVLPVLACVVVLRDSERPTWSRHALATLLSGCLALGVALPAWFMAGGGPHFDDVNRYHTVYAGVVKLVDDPKAVLLELGIPPEFHELPRRDVFSGRVSPDHPVHAALAEVSRSRVLRSYVDHPEAIARASSAVGRELLAERTHQRGTGERPGPRRYDTRLWEYGRFRQIVVARAAWFWWLLPLGALVLGVRGLFAARRRAPSSFQFALLFLPIWIASQAVVVVLGDGLVSLRQHLLGARLALDLLLVVSLALAFDALARFSLRVLRGRKPAIADQ